MPTEHDDDDHDVVSAHVTTISVSPEPTEIEVLEKPSDHIDRPVNIKSTTSPKSTAVASQTTNPEKPTIHTSSSPSATKPAAEHLLPNYFPTFGVSKRTQIWIYGSATIIIIFCAALGAYFYVQRRKRIRSSRDEYEFDVLDDDDDHTAMKGGKDGNRVKKRAGELYDAFAGESDEEELLSSDEDEPYRDEADDADGRDTEENEKKR